MSDLKHVSKLLSDMSEQIRGLGQRMKVLCASQAPIETANMYMERWIYSLSTSKSILSFDVKQSEPPKAEQAVDNSIPVKNPNAGIPPKSIIYRFKRIVRTISQIDSQPVMDANATNTSTISRQTRVSTKRQREPMFTLERQRSSLPKRLQNDDDIATMERILQFIATKKTGGVVLKDVALLVNKSTIRCNEYLNGLMKIGEIIRTQTRGGIVYSLDPNRYYKYLNS